MEIKVLGTGCPKCNKLEKLVKEVLADTGTDATVEKVTDINAIAKAGVMMTPALMIDGDIKLTGKLPSKPDLEKMITGS